MNPRLRAYAQLVRLPNVFTALADIGLGWWVIGGRAAPGSMLLLGLSSACLYCGGMVWNDYFDIDQDRRERPFRPLPSGRISSNSARRLGVSLFVAGLGFAVGNGVESAATAGVLAVAILAYDGRLKRFWAGPPAMGSCRFLNVLLAFSVVEADVVPWPLRLHLASVVGLYIVGVTWFARTEARTSHAAQLRGAAGVMVAAMLLALAVPLRLAPGAASPAFPYLLVVFIALVGAPVARACAEPEPKRVQAAVKRAVLGLVGLDAALACAIAGIGGLSLLLLLPPGLLLGRRLYTT